MQRSKAFTLIELMVVVSIIALMSGGLTFINFLRARENTFNVLCLENRRIIEHAEIKYLARQGRHSVGFQDLVDAGHLHHLLTCKAGGVYAWVPFSENDHRYQTIVGCSVHGAGVSSAAGGVVAFDFDDGHDAGWVKIGNNWEVIDGKYYGGPGGEHRSFYGDSDWANYTLEVDVALLAGTNSGGYGYGIYFRANDFENRNTLNAYVFQYDPGFGHGEFLIRKVVNGRETAPLVRAEAPAGYQWMGDEKNVKIQVSGNTFTAYMSDVNGGAVPILTASDSDFSSGVIGFRTWSDSYASFDNLSVSLED